MESFQRERRKLFRWHSALLYLTTCFLMVEALLSWMILLLIWIPSVQTKPANWSKNALNSIR